VSADVQSVTRRDIGFLHGRSGPSVSFHGVDMNNFGVRATEINLLNNVMHANCDATALNVVS
jgi:hypothetical protein